MLTFKRILFYIASFTWGIIMSLIGGIVMLISLPFHRVKVWHGRAYAIWGKGWGGLELGCFFICGEDCQSEYLLAHESGHGLQNIILGPLMPFLVCIPSAIRYWYRELRFNRRGLTPPTSYDAIWFEGWATKWGYRFIVTDRI